MHSQSESSKVRDDEFGGLDQLFAGSKDERGIVGIVRFEEDEPSPESRGLGSESFPRRDLLTIIIVLKHSGSL
jgi:hypothetical protein